VPSAGPGRAPAAGHRLRGSPTRSARPIVYHWPPSLPRIGCDDCKARRGQRLDELRPVNSDAGEADLGKDQRALRSEDRGVHLTRAETPDDLIAGEPDAGADCLCQQGLDSRGKRVLAIRQVAAGDYWDLPAADDFARCVNAARVADYVAVVNGVGGEPIERLAQQQIVVF